jgi:NADPH:quinone reductase-like Zn-dependent oxidoreductase
VRRGLGAVHQHRDAGTVGRLDHPLDRHDGAERVGDVVFDGIGGAHIWRSRKAVRPGGIVVAYGLTGSLRGGRLASARPGRHHRFREIAIFGLYIAGGWLLPGRKRVVPYSIQWLKRLRPALFRQDLIALFDLLHQRKIKPLIAQRFPLAEAESRARVAAERRHDRQDRSRAQRGNSGGY